MTMVETSRPVRDMAPTRREPHPSRRRRVTRLFIVCGVLVSLAWLLDFDPLHPIHWVHELRASFDAGQRAGAAARLRNAQPHQRGSAAPTPAR